jgi:hypothetical protein
MGIPQVPEQVRRAPILALRAVFAGIGRILMSADRAEASSDGAQPAAGTSLAERQLAAQRQLAAARRQRSRTAPPAEPSSRWRSLDQTGNVRLLSAEDADEDVPPIAAEDAGEKDVPTAAAVPPIADETASAHALPLASYDSLSLASIRARLRGLDVAQLRVLLDYEAANAERPEVLGMFERRIEKLESGG